MPLYRISESAALNQKFLNSKKEGAPLNLEAGVYGEDIGKEWQDEHKSN